MEQASNVSVAVVEVAPLDPAEMVAEIAQLPRDQFLLAVEALPPDLRELAEQMHEELRVNRLQLLSDLAKKLQSDKLDPIIRAKRVIEDRWAEDERQYNGLDRNIAKADRKQFADAEVEAIPPPLNLTGNRTNIWAARVINMVCPGSILPGDTVPTPDPTMAGGQTPQTQDNFEGRRREAERRAQKMSRVIRDQFAECALPRDLRRAAHDLCKLGFGVLSGPHQRLPKRTKFKSAGVAGGLTVYQAETGSKPRPTWSYLNPRYFFPEMVKRIEDASYAFELQLLTKRELHTLSTQFGFRQFADNFAELLDPDYKATIKGEIAANLTQWNSKSSCRDAIEDRFAVWRFIGHVDQKYLQALGLSEPGELRPQLMELYFCEDKILYADYLIPDGVARLPYYGVSLYDIDDTMFGVGIPYLARDGQASINALWRAAQFNALVSAGPQLGYIKGRARPLDGDYRAQAPKSWEIDDTQARSINDVISALMIPNNSRDLLALLQMRIQLFDEEINLPLIAQGQPDQATPTASGLQLQMRAASVAILNIGQACEDGWITPLFESAYHWNMIYNDDESIKGDYDCVSRLVSDNVMREIKATNLLMLSSMKAQDQDLATRLKPDIFYPRLMTALEQDVDMIMTDAELQEAAKNRPQPPPDPRLLDAETKRRQVEADIEFRRMDRELDHQERMRELDIRDREAIAREYVADRQLEVQLVEIAERSNLSLESLRTQLGMAAIKEQTKVGIAAAREQTARARDGQRLQAEAEKIAARERETALEVQVEQPKPRIL